MKISVTFRNTEGEDWFKNYVSERLEKLHRYLDKPAEAHVVLSVEKFRNVAEINLSDNGVNIIAKEEAKEMIMAIDNAVEKIERQLKKHKEKMRVHKNVSTREEQEAEGAEGELSQGKIADFRRVVLAHLTADDAISQMEEKKKRFFLFRDASSGKVCLLYRHDSGGYGLIETNA